MIKSTFVAALKHNNLLEDVIIACAFGFAFTLVDPKFYDVLFSGMCLIAVGVVLYRRQTKKKKAYPFDVHFLNTHP